MDRKEMWRHIAEQRLAVAEALIDLDPDEWERPSLCEGWRVRDVVAHIGLAPEITWGMTLREFARAHGSFHRFIRETAIDRAALPNDELIAIVRRVAPHNDSLPEPPPRSRCWTSSSMRKTSSSRSAATSPCRSTPRWWRPTGSGRFHRPSASAPRSAYAASAYRPRTRPGRVATARPSPARSRRSSSSSPDESRQHSLSLRRRRADLGRPNQGIGTPASLRGRTWLWGREHAARSAIGAVGRPSRSGQRHGQRAVRWRALRGSCPLSTADRPPRQFHVKHSSCHDAPPRTSQGVASSLIGGRADHQRTRPSPPSSAAGTAWPTATAARPWTSATWRPTTAPASPR